MQPNTETAILNTAMKNVYDDQSMHLTISLTKDYDERTSSPGAQEFLNILLTRLMVKLLEETFNKGFIKFNRCNDLFRISKLIIESRRLICAARSMTEISYMHFKSVN